MGTDAIKKVDFILAWYRKERVRFSFSKQVLLAKTWMDICAKNEEYEMTDALKKEMAKVIEVYLNNKRTSRTWKQKFRYFYIKLKRKIRSK